jgi:TIR domain
MFTEIIFCSYSRSDSVFVIKLATVLREARVPLWIDQINIKAGSQSFYQSLSIVRQVCRLYFSKSNNSTFQNLLIQIQ